MNMSQPPTVLASEISLPLNFSMSFGMTGIIIPMPMQSISIVEKIKPMVAFFEFSIKQRC